MKILIVLSSIDKTAGGPSRSVPMLAKGLAEMGVNVTLMCIKSQNMNTDILINSNVKIHIITKKYQKKDLDNFIKSESFDVIHGQSIWEPIYHQIRIIADKYFIPFILTPRGMLEPWSLQQKKWKKKLAMLLYQYKDLSKCACIYATAEMEAMHIRDLGLKNPICVIPNSIDIDSYPCRASIDGVKKQVLFLSRIHKKKGIEYLINAWYKISDYFKDWELLIVGNGEDSYINSLKNRINFLNLENNIKILPPVFGKEKVKLYQSSALFILPSFSENFGMVIAEALSCGVPVITTNNTPWEMLNKHQIGWSIPLNEQELINTLKISLALNKEELYNMGQRGSSIIKNKFNYQKITLQNKELYEWLIYKKRKPTFILD